MYIYMTTTFAQKKAIPQSCSESSWSRIQPIRPISPLKALASPVAYVTSKRTVFCPDINTVHSHISSPAYLRLEYWITCWERTCVWSACDHLLSWDLIWQATSALDDYTLLQMLQICSEWKLSETKVISSYESDWMGRQHLWRWLTPLSTQCPWYNIELYHYSQVHFDPEW